MRIRMDRSLGVFLPALGIMGGIAAVRLSADADTLWQMLRPQLKTALTVLGAILLHECGHLAAAWGVGVRVRGLRLDLLGARLELDGLLSYGQELFVAAAGPLASLLGAVLACPLWAARGWEDIGLFASVSMVLAGVNLLPIGTLDGGRMLSCAVASLWGEGTSRRVCRAATGALAVALWLLAAYALLRAGEMLSLFVFAVCLLLRSRE